LKCGLQKSVQRTSGCASFDRKIGRRCVLAGWEPRRPLTRRRGASQANGCAKLFSSRVQPGKEASIRGGNPRSTGPDGRRSRPFPALVPNPDDVGAVLVERVNARRWIGRVSDRSGVASQPTSGVDPFDGARATTRNVRDRQTTVKAPPAGTVRGVGVGDHDKWPRWRAIETSIEAGTSQHLVHQRRVEPARTARAWTAEPTF